MTAPFEMWSDRIAAADTDEARRALLVDAARWRAQHLGDIAAARRATHVVSRLHWLLGERDRAVSEARQLLSLCQTTPVASAEEIEAARAWLQGLGERAPKVVVPPPPRPTRRDASDGREARPPRPPRAEAPREAERREAERKPSADARALASRGDWDGALKALDGAKGASAAVLRAYVQLSSALAGDDPVPAVRAVAAELGRAAGLGAARGEPVTGDPLSELLGAPVPHKRAPRIRLIEEFAERHPERIDELAAASLRHHLMAIGPEVPAPWLVGAVGRALATGEGAATRAAIDELRAARAVAVQAYDEWPFERLVRLITRAVATGTAVGPMRRGVLAGGEPDERKLWTLRLGEDRMIAVAPHATAPYAEPAKADELAERLHALSPRTLLVATGFGNAGLRAAAQAKGLAVRERDGDDDELLAAVAALAAAPAAPEAARPVVGPDRLEELLRAEAFDAEAVAAAVQGYRRPDRALRTIQRLDLPDERVAAVLRAVDRAFEPGRPIPEGTTVAVRAAAAGPLTRELLVGGPLAGRFGGPGIDVVVALAAALRGAGWEVHRVLRGPTRRETQAHPALETLSGAMGGVWRLLVRQGERKGEVWYLAELPPEARAGVPQLLVEDWQRVVVLPLEPDVLQWYGTLANAPQPIGWTGSEGDAVVAAVDQFVATAAEAESGEEAAAG